MKGRILAAAKPILNACARALSPKSIYAKLLYRKLTDTHMETCLACQSIQQGLPPRFSSQRPAVSDQIGFFFSLDRWLSSSPSHSSYRFHSQRGWAPARLTKSIIAFLSHIPQRSLSQLFLDSKFHMCRVMISLRCGLHECIMQISVSANANKARDLQIEIV